MMLFNYMSILLILIYYTIIANHIIICILPYPYRNGR